MNLLAYEIFIVVVAFTLIWASRFVKDGKGLGLALSFIALAIVLVVNGVRLVGIDPTGAIGSFLGAAAFGVCALPLSYRAVRRIIASRSRTI